MTNDTKRKGDTWMLHRLLWDLGLDNPEDDEAVSSKIREVEERFHLVMILEHFEVEIIENGAGYKIATKTFNIKWRRLPVALGLQVLVDSRIVDRYPQ